MSHFAVMVDIYNKKSYGYYNQKIWSVHDKMFIQQ